MLSYSIAMKIGIISDTHDNLKAIDHAINLFKAEDVGLIIHLGDFVAPFSVKRLLDCGIPLRAVFGNNDGERRLIREFFSSSNDAVIFESVGKIEVNDRKIAFTHGHHEYVLESLIMSKQFDVVLSGHTHRIKTETTDGVLHLNPGEAGGWLFGKGSVIVLDTNTLNYKIEEYDIHHIIET